MPGAKRTSVLRDVLASELKVKGAGMPWPGAARLITPGFGTNLPGVDDYDPAICAAISVVV